MVPPVRIWTSDGSVTAGVDCKDPMPLGETGAEATKTLPPADGVGESSVDRTSRRFRPFA